MIKLYQGDRAPTSLGLELSFDARIDFEALLTLVNNAIIKVTDPAGTCVEWAITGGMADVPNRKATVYHILAGDGSDLPLSGQYAIRAWGTNSVDAVFATNESVFFVHPRHPDWPSSPPVYPGTQIYLVYGLVEPLIHTLEEPPQQTVTLINPQDVLELEI